MRRFAALLILFACLCACAISGDRLIESSVTAATSTAATNDQSTFEKGEAAYRENNLGVALLEQYKAKDAIDCGEAASALQQVTCKRPLVENRGPRLT